MIFIDPADYPSIRWRWRVYHGPNFVTYLLATTTELMLAQVKMAFAVDRDHMTIDLL